MLLDTTIAFICHYCGFTSTKHETSCGLCKRNVPDLSGRHEVKIFFARETKFRPEINFIGKKIQVQTKREGYKSPEVFTTKIVGETSTFWQCQHPDAEHVTIFVPKVAAQVRCFVEQ